MGLGSGIRKKPIPDPGVKKQPDSGSGSATLQFTIQPDLYCRLTDRVLKSPPTTGMVGRAGRRRVRSGQSGSFTTTHSRDSSAASPGASMVPVTFFIS
jgi:hypothetical protein